MSFDLTRAALGCIFAGLAMAAGCGTTASVSDASVSDASVNDASAHAKGSGVPKLHRAEAAACDGVRPSRPPIPGDDGGTLRPGSDCAIDANCTAGRNGRCFVDPFGGRCTYDECTTDDACGAGKACGCSQGLDESDVCLPAACRTDADCGTGKYCSPSPGVCNPDAKLGFYCHGVSDECLDSSECVNGECAYFPALGRFKCAERCVF